MTLQDILSLKKQALSDISGAADPAALEQARIRYLGRNGLIPALMKNLKDVAPEDKAACGREMNALRQDVGQALESRKSELAPQGSAEARAAFDFSLPGRWRGSGSMHPVSMVIEEATRIFARMGFTVADGPDIETRFNNFEALNTPAHHPSMDARDTFWLDDGRVLRTQTSPVQIRTMLERQPPVRIVNPGRCYRRDTTDATHSANFHQIEGLYVDAAPVSLADLKSTLAHFAREMMGPEVKVRFRPHFFPFTEPSVEVDFSCHICGGSGCRVCKQSGWIEIAGAGMVDPRVYAKVNYPNDLYGYAFGMGVERIAMIKFGITDIRLLYENDLRYLRQFA
jgi:phenylalanyl-tRNA synthetase alpha chain